MKRYCFVPTHVPLYVPEYAAPDEVTPVNVPEFGCVNVPLLPNAIEHCVQQFVCVLPLTSPMKHWPPVAAPTAEPELPERAKAMTPLAGLGGIVKMMPISPLDRSLTVIVPLDVLVPPGVPGGEVTT